MKKTLFFAHFFFACLYVLQAQTELPVIYSFKTDIQIRLDQELQPRKFRLLPQQKPDFFPLSENSDFSTITFSTDVDSATLQLDGHTEKELVVILNGKDSCFIKVVYEKTSYFTSSNYAFILMAVAFLVVIGYVSLNKYIPLKIQLSTGWISASLFWLVLFISGLLQSKYDHITMRISELANMGSGSEYFLSISLFVVSLLVFCFAFTLLRHGSRFKILPYPFVLLALAPVVYFLPIYFPFHMMLETEVGPSVFSVLVVQLISLATWLRLPAFALVQKYTLLCVAIFLLASIQFIPGAGNLYKGLFQRLYHVSWTLWFFLLSLHLLKNNVEEFRP